HSLRADTRPAFPAASSICASSWSGYSAIGASILSSSAGVAAARHRGAPGASSDRQIPIVIARRLVMSVALLHEAPPRDRPDVVVGAFFRSRRKRDPLARQLLVGNPRQDVGDGIEPRRLLVVGPDDVPWRQLRVGLLQHQ